LLFEYSTLSNYINVKLRQPLTTLATLKTCQTSILKKLDCLIKTSLLRRKIVLLWMHPSFHRRHHIFLCISLWTKTTKIDTLIKPRSLFICLFSFCSYGFFYHFHHCCSVLWKSEQNIGVSLLKIKFSKCFLDKIRWN
jgi:hypothetical protein